MAAELLLCMSQEDAHTPYRFKMTGINVYSIEEAAYHCFTYWKQSIGVPGSVAFLAWVKNDLGLPLLASKIAATNKLQTTKEKMTAFLRLLDNFDEIRLAALGAQMEEWENRLEWERLKEQGDYLMEKGATAQALSFYDKALAIQADAKLLNNKGIALMKLRRFPQAQEALAKALFFLPKNIQILMNLAEAEIFCRHFAQAEQMLMKAEALLPEHAGKYHADIFYLYGELRFAQDDLRAADDFFEQAIAISPQAHTIARLSDVYIRRRQTDKAIACLQRTPAQNKAYLMKMAELYAEADNMPAAIRTIEHALLEYTDDVQLWTKLAAYYRLDYNVSKADGAIAKARAIDRQNEAAMLEHARIKKAQGNMKAYQNTLGEIMAGFREKYREQAGESCETP